MYRFGRFARKSIYRGPGSSTAISLKVPPILQIYLFYAILVLLTTRPAVFTYAHISPIHTARRMVSSIGMPVYAADADCSLFPLIIRLSVFAV